MPQVQCEACGRSCAGASLQCALCEDYHLCPACFLNRRADVHPAHYFRRALPCTADEARERALAPRVTATITDASGAWANVICDNCLRLGLPSRYKCAECEDYDLCHACFAYGKHVHDAGHCFVLMKASGDVDPSRSLRQPLPSPPDVVVDGASCDNCGAKTMRHAYACCECDDYALCGPCFDRRKHAHHAFHILYSPSSASGSGDEPPEYDSDDGKSVSEQVAAARAILDEGVELVKRLEGQIERIGELKEKREGRMVLWGVGAILSHGLLAPGLVTASDKFNTKINTELELAEERTKEYVEKLEGVLEDLDAEVQAAMKDSLENVLGAIKNRVEVIESMQPNWIGCRNWNPITGLVSIIEVVNQFNDSTDN